MNSPIETSICTCLRAFEDLVPQSMSYTYGYSQEVSRWTWKYGLERPRVWAANVGFSGPEQDAFESRLIRSSSHVNNQITSHLQDLSEVTDRIHHALAHCQVEDLDSNLSEDSLDSDSKAKLQHFHHETHMVIGCLNRMSMLVPRPSPNPGSPITDPPRLSNLASTTHEDDFGEDESVLESAKPSGTQWISSPAAIAGSAE